jgi:hypothetical protein
MAYRPARFGGPGQGEVHVGDESAQVSGLTFFSPEAVAPMVLQAVRNNRPFVFDHPEQRIHFRETYSSVVEACYDDAEAWEREHGVPDANPHGAKLVTS